MPTKHLTAKSLEALKTDKPVEDFWDRSLKGFVVRVTSKGTKSFSIVYRNSRRERKRYAFGEYPHMTLADARDKAFQLLSDVLQGQDPNEAEKAFKRSNTVSELCDLYIKYHALPNKRPSSVQKDEQAIKKDIRPVLGKFKISEVKRANIISVLDRIRHDRSAPVQANRTRALLHKLFSFAIERGLIEYNPCSGIKSLAKESPRSRILDNSELTTLIIVLEEYPERSLANMLLLLLLTGQRIGEVSNMKWDEIKDSQWTIPAEKAKNGQSHCIFLSPWAHMILDNQKIVNKVLFSENEKVQADNYVFNTKRGPRFEWKYKALKRLYKAIQNKVQELDLESFPRWTPHDLRRTIATYLEEEGFSSDVIDRLQNHVKSKVTRVYQKGNRSKEIREALIHWEKYLTTLKESNRNAKAAA